MSDKKSPFPYKNVPNPKLPESNQPEAIFLSTVSAADFKSKLMPLNNRLYMYHIDNTDMCTSDEDSGPELNGTDSEEMDNRKPSATEPENTKPPAIKSKDTELVAVKTEDVQPTVTSEPSTTEVGTQTTTVSSPNTPKVKK